MYHANNTRAVHRSCGVTHEEEEEGRVRKFVKSNRGFTKSNILDHDHDHDHEHEHHETGEIGHSRRLLQTTRYVELLVCYCSYSTIVTTITIVPITLLSLLGGQ